MTARELINKLMDLNLDKEIYITRPVSKNGFNNCVGYAGDNPIEFAEEQIIDVGVHGVYGEFLNCITIK